MMERHKGLYKNGALWWLRIRAASGLVKPRSTGTDDLKLANKIAEMVEDLRDDRKQADVLEQLAQGTLKLLDLYNARASGRQHILLASVDEQAKARTVADLQPVVKRWYEKHLPDTRAGEETRDQYLRHVRALIPEGAPFPASKFTEETLRDALRSLTDARTKKPLSTGTRRRFFTAWSLFYDYARTQVVFPTQPFANAKSWRPANGAAKDTFWFHDTVLDIISRMEGEVKVVLALAFGAGMELSAIQALTGADVSKKKSEPLVHAAGTKSEYRDRYAEVSAWAWPIIYEHAASFTPRASLFPELGERLPERVRVAFYNAQVEAGLIEEPPRSAAGPKLWKAVSPHTLHDARHTFAVCKLFDLDGEGERSTRWIAEQLGHADEQMVIRVYGRTRRDARIKLQLLRREKARKTA